MISEKDYNEIYLKGCEENKKIEQIYPLNNESDEFRVLADKINEIIDKINSLKIHYEIKPSFTTRKLKQLQKENEQLKAELQKANDNIIWWSNRFKAVQRDYENLKERIDKTIELTKNLLKTEYRGYYQIIFKEILKSLGDKE